jgi:hypothetical protein
LSRPKKIVRFGGDFRSGITSVALLECHGQRLLKGFFKEIDESIRVDVRLGVILDKINEKLGFSSGSIRRVIDKDLQFKRCCAVCAKRIVAKRNSFYHEPCTSAIR